MNYALYRFRQVKNYMPDMTLNTFHMLFNSLIISSLDFASIILEPQSKSIDVLMKSPLATLERFAMGQVLGVGTDISNVLLYQFFGLKPAWLRVLKQRQKYLEHLRYERQGNELLKEIWKQRNVKNSPIYKLLKLYYLKII